MEPLTILLINGAAWRKSGAQESTIEEFEIEIVFEDPRDVEIVALSSFDRPSYIQAELSGQPGRRSVEIEIRDMADWSIPWASISFSYSAADVPNAIPKIVRHFSDEASARAALSFVDRGPLEMAERRRP